MDWCKVELEPEPPIIHWKKTLFPVKKMPQNALNQSLQNLDTPKLKITRFQFQRQLRLSTAGPAQLATAPIIAGAFSGAERNAAAMSR